MLHLLQKNDEPALLHLLEKDKIHNLPFYGYLPYLSNIDSRFGFYGKYKEDQLIAAVYFSPYNMGVAIEEEGIIHEVYDLLVTLPSTFLYGRKDILEKMGEFPYRSPHPYAYGYLTPLEDEFNERVAAQATFNDKQQLLSFYEGKNIQLELAELLDSLLAQGNVFVVRNEAGTIASAAIAHSETEEYALIGAVYTNEDDGGKGYAGAVVQALRVHLSHKGITPFLFYEADKKQLEHFYEKLSFEKVADYVMWHD
ncbi:GNAT family N-acetyltransferase [Pontibacillus salicampi]|uniref:GNAT family N-acetyltransferase n=1 Tax=Pontibacillus salicampi TaxID=1449801 RepID=A0ABV6LJ41_9BACI